MDYKDTLVMAIQTIPGRTAAEKHKYINVTAQEIADKKRDIGTLPKPLRPLMNVEVAKVTNELDLIVEALQTSEALLCSRALQIPDLFPSEDSPLLNWDHFNNLLLSRVSLTTRYKLIKKVSQDLQTKNPEHADTFYTKVCKHYDEKEALPLLLACSETFIRKQLGPLIHNLPLRYLSNLYTKYPDLIVAYFKIIAGLDNEVDGNDMQWVSRTVLSFLPNLMDNHFCEMISVLDSDLFRKHRFSFGKRRTKMFLQKDTQLLLKRPNRFLPMLRLKVIVDRLSEDEFSTMMSNSITCSIEDFRYSSVKSKLHYFSNEKKVSLTKAAFKKTFGKDLINCPNNITPEFLELLPVEERISIVRMKLEINGPDNITKEFLVLLPVEERSSIVRMKLERDLDWHLNNPQWSWRVYLPFSEVFGLVTKKIAKTSDPDEREQLIHLLIFSTGVNNDKNGLLKVLEYFSTRHKNVMPLVIDSTLKTVARCFNISDLDQEHWDIMINLTKRLVWARNIQADMQVDMLRQCYLNDLCNHPQFMKFIEETVYSDLNRSEVKSCIKKYYPHLYQMWYPSHIPNVIIYRRRMFDELRDLKQNYEKVCSEWSNYYDLCFTTMTFAETKIFLKSLLWYDVLPKDFLSRSIQKIKEGKNTPLMVAILLGGPEFEKLMAPLIPEDPVIDFSDKVSVELYKLIKSLVTAARWSNPPVSLDTMKKLFSSDYLRICGEGMSSMMCRMPISTVVNFCSGFLEERVAVKKLMVELMCTVTPLKQRGNIFDVFLPKKCHSSIFGHVLKKSLKIFFKTPIEHTWIPIQKGLQSRIIEDPAILRDLLSFNMEPNVYLVSYVQELLSIFDKVNIEGYPNLRKELMEGVFAKLREEYMSSVLPDSLQRELIQKYIFDSLMDASKPQMNVYFIFDVFLHDDGVVVQKHRMVERAEFIMDCIVKSDCVVKSYPFFRKIISIFADYQNEVMGNEVMKIFLNGLRELFDSFIKPWRDTQTFLYLEWLKGFEDSDEYLDSEDFAVFLGTNLHVWIDMFGLECINHIKNIVDSFMCNVFGDDYDVNSFIEGLLKVKNRNSYVFAALFVRKLHNEKRGYFELKLLNAGIPTMKFLLYMNGSGS